MVTIILDDNIIECYEMLHKFRSDDTKLYVEAYLEVESWDKLHPKPIISTISYATNALYNALKEEDNDIYEYLPPILQDNMAVINLALPRNPFIFRWMSSQSRNNNIIFNRAMDYEIERHNKVSDEIFYASNPSLRSIPSNVLKYVCHSSRSDTNGDCISKLDKSLLSDITFASIIVTHMPSLYSHLDESIRKSRDAVVSFISIRPSVYRQVVNGWSHDYAMAKYAVTCDSRNFKYVCIEIVDRNLVDLYLSQIEHVSIEAIPIAFLSDDNLFDIICSKMTVHELRDILNLFLKDRKYKPTLTQRRIATKHLVHKEGIIKGLGHRVIDNIVIPSAGIALWPVLKLTEVIVVPIANHYMKSYSTTH